MAKLLTYEQKDTWMDRLCGVTKLIYFLAWSITSMLTYDTRVLAVMLVLSLILFKISKTEWKQVGSIFKFIMFFLVINVLAIFIFAPDQGTKIYGTKHVLWQLSAHYPITAEQLFYELNIILKYFTIIPAVFIFVVTTNPSEFAASLNRIGISYNSHPVSPVLQPSATDAVCISASSQRPQHAAAPARKLSVPDKLPYLYSYCTCFTSLISAFWLIPALVYKE